MGAVKSVPVVGEVVLAAEVASKSVACVVVAPFSTDAAEGIARSVEQGVKDYAERSVTWNAAETVVRAIADDDFDDEELKKKWKKVGSSCLELADGLPVVGHVKGVIHYATGDREKGDACMKAASRSLAVTVATVATGGAAGAVLATGAAVGTGLGMDCITTIVDSAVHDEFRPSGHIAAINQIAESDDKAAAVTDAILGAGVEIGMTYLAAKHCETTMAKKNSTTRFYRVMEASEATNAVESSAVPQGYRAGTGPLGETWGSESVRHPQKYLPQQQARVPAGVELKTVEFKVDKPYYKAMKENKCIPQRGANQVNTGGNPVKNVFNKEHLANHPKGKVNVGIKNANLGEFNEHVKFAKKIDPLDWRHRNGVTMAISRHGEMAFDAGAVRQAGEMGRKEGNNWDF